MNPDPQRGPALSDVVLSGSPPGLSVSSRETCVSSVDSQWRQSPGLDSGGLGPHCNTSDFPDDSRDFSASTGFFWCFHPRWHSQW